MGHAKRVRSIANLKRMKLENLDKFLQEDVIFEGDYLELRLFVMYLKVYQPSNEDIMKITHEERAEIDHANLQQKYFVLEKQPNPYDIPVKEEKKETPSSSREEELVEWLNVQKKRVGDLKMEKYAIQKEKEEVVQW